jgi:hypothetical protein
MGASPTSGLTYLQAAGIAYNPFESGFSLGDALNTLVNNGVFGLGGYVSPSYKASLISAEASSLVTSSGGTLTQAEATAQATDDITGSLLASGADPSLAPSLLNSIGPALNWIIVIGFLLLAIQLLSTLRALT